MNVFNDAVLTILAPTASGKTDLMVEWAKKYPIEVISVDSAMVYKELSIGANKLTKEELIICPHHIVDVTTIENGYDVGSFFKDSIVAVEDILARGKIPVFVGGTMMYIYQLKNGLAVIPEIPAIDRDLFRKQLNDQTLDEQYAALQACDPRFAARVQKTDKQRIGRGLEIYYLTGKALSDYWSEPAQEYPYDLNIHGLIVSDKEDHRLRVAKRAELMLERGFVEEVQALKSLYPSLDHDFWSFVGYRQVRCFLDGVINRDQLTAMIEASTWQLVKRQKTWLKKFDVPLWQLDFSQKTVCDNFKNIFEKYCCFVLEKGISRKK